MVQSYMELYHYTGEFIVMAHTWCKNESCSIAVSFSASDLEIENIKSIKKEIKKKKEGNQYQIILTQTLTLPMVNKHTGLIILWVLLLS